MVFGLYSTAILASLLGILVIMRNAKGKTHRLFFALSLAISAWIISNAMFTQAPNCQIAYIVALLSYSFAALTATLFLLFSADLSETTLKNQRLTLILAGIFTVLSAVPGFLATNVIDQKINTTPFILAYALGITGLLGGGLVLLFKGLKTTRGQRRQQLGAVLIGLTGSVAGGIIFNLILPVQGNYKYILLGPAFSILFVLCSTYAIFRHKLFDLRSTIVRFVAYCMALLTILILYAVAIYGIILPLFGDWIGASIVFVYPVLGILMAITFQPIKKFFRAITKAIFFRNTYNTEKVIDNLGSILVREIDVSRLLKKSEQLLSTAVKPTGIEVVVTKDQQRVHSILHGRQLKHVDELLVSLGSKANSLIVTDYLSERGSPLYHQLVSAGIAVVVPLITPNAELGYLFVGYKASGDAFTDQDIDLIRIFTDELAVAVQNALRYEEISHFNSTLKSEVENATSQLRESNHKLQRLDEVKDEFISMASHQLRTPLTGVKGYLSMVLEGDAGEISKDQRRLLEEAYSSAQRMVYLIGDFLNISRLQTGKFILEEVPVNLSNIVHEEVEQLQAAAAMRNIDLIYYKPVRFPESIIDDGKIRQVLMNFIDNAIFYSKPNGKVTIELTSSGKDVILQVHDDGIGVPQNERHRIFTKFFRASNARKVRPDGTGIGLYMAKKVIAAHGGSIIFETRENKGSTFGFKLPLKH